jgi:very-short-patch-repair endonuclease
VVELDGGQHDRPHQADSDRDRDLWLRAHGYVVRRYGDGQISDRPGDVIADLLEALS